MEKWAGKIAVITGGSSGMGRAVAQKFLDNKIKVAVLDVNPSDNKNVHFIKCDVSDLNSLKKAFEEVEKKFKFIHILINNAGIIRSGKVFDMSEENTQNLNKVIDVNIKGVVHAAREGYQLIKKSNDYGLIVNFCSIVGHSVPFGNPFMVYSSTKYAVKAFSEILRQELITTGDEKIRVSNLSPGTVKTGILDPSGKEISTKYMEEEPTLKPENVADAILYLLSTPYNVNITELTIKPLGEKC